MIRLFPTGPGDATAGTSADPPTVTDVASAVAGEARPPHDDRPWVYTNMVASADGGTAVEGVSGGLGGDGDRQVFAALRDAADAILVGASTVRQERYRPPRRDAEVRDRRRAEGRAPDPRLAVVTGSLELDPDLPLFGDPDNRPVIVTAASAPAEARHRLADVAEIVDCGDESVDLGTALVELARRGVGSVLAEGGPSLNGQLIADDLVDEWNLSLSPRLLSGDSRRAAVGPVPDGPPRGMRLVRVWTDDDFLFCRWVRDRSED